MTNGNAAPPQQQSWESWATRTAAILAVVAALSSGQWGSSNLRAILEQGKVNDEWAFFQAKSIKAQMAERMGTLGEALGGRTPSMDAYVKKMGEETVRLNADKAAAQATAEGYQRARDNYVERSFWFELAFACLQVGVVLSTIAVGAKKKFLWIVAILFGILGAGLGANGWVRVLRTPEYAQKLAPPLAPEIPVKGGGG
jgi:hypothetical protein